MPVALSPSIKGYLVAILSTMVVLIVRVAIADSIVGSSRVDLQACKLEYSIVSPK